MQDTYIENEKKMTEYNNEKLKQLKEKAKQNIKEKDGKIEELE